VSLQPSHPNEPALHHQLRDALNAELTNNDFFVWIEIRPTGQSRELATLPSIVSETEQWLAGLDPDAIDNPEELPEIRLSDPAADVTVRAIPKRQEARGRRAQEIVGNPDPILVGWTTF
jgi:hypothetical protein